MRIWLGELAQLVSDGELAPKTINNARTCLSVALNEAVARGLLVRNPCARVKPLPAAETERDFLRLHEIDAYLEACPDYYRLLAEVLIGTGARISEALALKWQDIDFHGQAMRIYASATETGQEPCRPKASASAPS